jgi:BrxA
MPVSCQTEVIGESRSAVNFRDKGPYSSRNTSKGALVDETAKVLNELLRADVIADVRRQVLTGSLLPQRSRNTRRHIWTAINRRYLNLMPNWAVDDLAGSARGSLNNRSLISLIYLHFCLRDRLTYDFVTRVVWRHWLQNRLNISREDVLSFLDEAAGEHPQIRVWSTSSRLKLAGNVLTALRDFGMLEGVQRKLIIKPDLPAVTAEHLVRLEATEGLKGVEVLQSSDWKLFLRTENEVAELLQKLSSPGGIRFERVGTTVLLNTPPEWTDTNDKI